jgi:hypothetical protein
MGLYKGGLIYGGGGGAYTWTIFCVSNKQVRHKQVSHKQENKHVLSWAYINSEDLYSGGLYSGGLIFWGAYIWNEVSISTCGGLIHGGLIFGGLIVGGLRYETTAMFDICYVIFISFWNFMIVAFTQWIFTVSLYGMYYGKYMLYYC